MSVSQQKVTVRVPATTANLGPAYDILGLSLDVWLTVTVERIAPTEESSVTMTGEGAAEMNAFPAKENLILKCFLSALEECGEAPFPVKVTAHNDVPFGCGCGSSSAATVAGLIAGFRMCGKTFSTKSEELLQVATRIEGHPDNAAPAIYGGLQLGLHNGSLWVTHRIGMPSGLWIVLFTPEKKMKLHTNETRKLIPTSVAMADVVHNMARSALLVRAFEAGDLASLRECGDDRLHQQQRAPLFPHMNPAISAAMEEGAAYACLSGAGPTIVAFVPGRSGDTALMSPAERLCDRVGKAMVNAAAGVDIAGRYIVTSPTDGGAHLN